MMLDKSQSQREIVDFKFNSSKSCLFTVGKNYKDQLASLHFGDGNVSWSDSMKYPGIHFMSNKRLKVDMPIPVLILCIGQCCNYSLEVC